MWYVYGEGGGEFTNLKDARKAAKEFSTQGNEMDGYGNPGEVNIWKDGDLFMTYSGGKLVYDGWTIKNYTYKVKNLQTLEEETVTVSTKMKLDRAYTLSDGRRVQPLQLMTTKDLEGVKDSTNDEVNDYKPLKPDYKVVEHTDEEDEDNNNNSSKTESFNHIGLNLHQLKECIHTEIIDEAFTINDKLNPNLFNSNGEMKEDVRCRLVEIADTFISSIQENEVPLKVYDYWLVGSNADYNYSPESDIDIHVIVDMEVGVNPYLLRLLYDYIKSGFNDKYDIMVKGHEVELYLEDVKTSAVSNGVYSLKQAKWIKFPTKHEVKTFDIENTELYNVVYDKYSRLEDSEVEQFIDDLYLLRKESLTSEGEFGEGNLVFKQFRNNGYLDELKDRKYKYKSQQLTLENLKETLREEDRHHINNRKSVVSKKRGQTQLVNEFVQRAYDILIDMGNKSDMEMEVLKSDVINVESYMTEFSRAMHDRGIGFDIQDKQFYSEEECEVGEFTYFYLIIYRENWFDEE